MERLSTFCFANREMASNGIVNGKKVRIYGIKTRRKSNGSKA